MLKILLAGDIGVGENGRYHIGDESMFLYNYYSLIESNNIDVYITSRTISHPFIKDREVLRIDFSDKFLGLIKLCILILGFKLFPKNTKVGSLVKVIKNIDHIIISGGGNINSIWPGHLYFRFFICYIARIYDKDIFLSAQTIGPIKSKIDKILCNFILDKAKLISIRDKSFSLNFIDKKYRNKLINTYDDSFNNKIIYSVKNKFENNGKLFYIGLSIHINDIKDRNNYKIKNIIQEIINKNKNVKIVLIPHMFDKYNNGDISYMKEIIEGLTSDYVEINYNFLQECSESKIPLELIIEDITSRMNIVVTTRYHGAVFATKYAVPCLMIGRNDYELGKLTGIKETIGIKESTIIDLRKSIKHNKKLDNFIGNLSKIRKRKLLCVKNKLFINYYMLHVKNLIDRT